MTGIAIAQAVDRIGGLAEDISGYCTDIIDGVADYESADDEPASERRELREQAIDAITTAISEIMAMASQLVVEGGKL